VQSGQYQRDRSNVADRDRNRPPRIIRCSATRTRILFSRPNAIITTPVEWIAMVSTMSDRPTVQLPRSTKFLLPIGHPATGAPVETRVWQRSAARPGNCISHSAQPVREVIAAMRFDDSLGNAGSFGNSSDNTAKADCRTFQISR
jgi:hypothetical protein